MIVNIENCSQTLQTLVKWKHLADVTDSVDAFSENSGVSDLLPPR